MPGSSPKISPKKNGGELLDRGGRQSYIAAMLEFCCILGLLGVGSRIGYLFLTQETTLMPISTLTHKCCFLWAGQGFETCCLSLSICEWFSQFCVAQRGSSEFMYVEFLFVNYI